MVLSCRVGPHPPTSLTHGTAVELVWGQSQVLPVTCRGQTCRAVLGVLGGYAGRFEKESFPVSAARTEYNLFQCWGTERSEEDQSLASYLGLLLADFKMRPLLGPREEARQHCQLANLRGKPGPVCLIPVPHLSPLFYPLSLALPDSPRLPGSPPPHPPLEGGAWLHPRVSGLYAPSWQRS